MKLQQFLLIALLLSVSACGGRNSKSDRISFNSILEENGGNDNIEISAESMKSIIESIPSPLEIALIMRKAGASFDENLLNPQNNASSYLSDQAKALAIGIYSGDLGYINIYEKSFLAVQYLNAIKKLANEINIGQFFDFETVRRLASNSDKMDSLIFLSTVNFNKMDSYLRSQKRNNMSILMVTGTWIEGLYIASSNFKDDGNKKIMEWIGLQKIIIDQLILGLSAFKTDKYFKNLIDDITQLKNLYDKINIKYEYHEPESAEVNGRLVIIDKSTSIADISAAQVNQISFLIGQIRTRLVNNS